MRPITPICMCPSQTVDGRVVFLLPWQNRLIAGTTDHSCEVSVERSYVCMFSCPVMHGVKGLRKDCMAQLAHSKLLIVVSHHVCPWPAVGTPLF